MGLVKTQLVRAITELFHVGRGGIWVYYKYSWKSLLKILQMLSYWNLFALVPHNSKTKKQCFLQFTSFYSIVKPLRITCYLSGHIWLYRWTEYQQSPKKLKLKSKFTLFLHILFDFILPTAHCPHWIDEKTKIQGR